MPVIIVVGGQYGSEGKGKLVAHLATQARVDVAVKCGGSNAGHSVTRNGKTEILQQISTAVLNPNVRLLLAPGALIDHDHDLLLAEINRFGLTPARLGVDPFSAVISAEYKKREYDLGLRSRISSTLSGTGAATAAKVLRDPQLPLVKDLDDLRPFMVDVASELKCTLRQR